MLRTRYLEGELHLFENLPAPLTVNRVAQAFTEPVGHLTAIPTAALRGLLLQRLVQQGLQLIVENNLTMTLIMLPLVSQHLRALAVVASDHFIDPSLAVAGHLRNLSSTLAQLQQPDDLIMPSLNAALGRFVTVFQFLRAQM
jgi:hypothetical protein